MPEVTCQSQFRAERGEYLTASPAFVSWICDLPKEARLFPVTTDVGSQRDPMVVLVGLNATWTESR
jgi:hypothetical protein